MPPPMKYSYKNDRESIHHSGSEGTGENVEPAMPALKVYL